jgi:hypothetical protein
MTIRERVEQQPTFWLLSALLAGFMAGIATNEAIVRIAQLQVISKEEFNRLSQSSVAPKSTAVWTGNWETDTATYKNLRIHFTQSNGDVAATYRIPGQSSQVPLGRIDGRVRGNSLVGRWLEQLPDGDIGGEVNIVQTHDGQSFVGAYTRDREHGRSKHAWTGRRID